VYNLIRPWLFQLDPEQAHALSLHLVSFAGRSHLLGGLLRRWYSVPQRPVQAFGLTFANPVGLAAGYDKDGLGWKGLACLGFGHIEIGTVTPLPQAGNPKPRLFRLPEDQALINRMGFPGRGAAFVARQLQGSRPNHLVLGVNLGKNSITPLERAASDYLELMQVFARLADYLVINVSSPNTVGLRRLQARQALGELLDVITEKNRWLALENGRRTPLLVKLAPDLENNELDDALEVLLSHDIDGVIATNTTINRENLRSLRAIEAGGLSGAPLRGRSTQMVRQIVGRVQGKLPVIAAGGVISCEDFKEKLDAGAHLVQVYTGLVYRGPGLVRELLRGCGNRTGSHPPRSG
jgi:dihydroorotate dehydrogenase